MRPGQVLPFGIIVDGNKWVLYTHKSSCHGVLPPELEPHHQVQFSVILRISFYAEMGVAALIGYIWDLSNWVQEGKFKVKESVDNPTRKRTD